MHIKKEREDNDVRTVLDRQELVARLEVEINALSERIKALARERSDLGIRLSELRCEKERLELHRSSLLRNGKPKGEF